MIYKRLCDCADYRNERTAQIDYETYITTDNMIPNRGGISTVESLPDTKAVCKYLEGDILLSNIRPYFKKIWLANRKGGCSNDVLVVTAKEPFSPEFLYYVLSDTNFFNYDTATSKGTKMPRGTPKAIMKYLVPDYGIEKQSSIVSVLSAYDNLIEVNNKRIKALEQMAENLYKEWFVRFRFPGHETAEFENGIPRGWNITRCKDIVPVLTGKKDANYGDDGGPYPFFTCAQEPIQAPDYSFDCAAVLLAGNCDLNAKVYKGKFEAYQRTYVLSPHNITHLFLLYYVIKDNVERLKQASTGAAISFITKGMIERIHFLLPPNELLVRFHGIMDDLYTQKDVLMKLNKNLIKQRDLLLPRLMSGKLEV